MASSPAVSILVPSYNHARFIGAGIESVLAQTYGDWELVVADDCSSDHSAEVVRSYGDPRIRWLASPVNLGTYGAEQRALDASHGDLIAILNSDDHWHPDKLALQVSALARHSECAFAYTLGWKSDASGVPDPSEDVQLDWPTAPVQDALPFLLYENRILASSVIFRRHGLRFDVSCRYSGDWVALLEATRRGPGACVAERLTFWRIHGTNMSAPSQGQIVEEIRVREAIDRRRTWWRASAADRSAIDLGLARNAINLVALYAAFLDKPRVLRWAWRAIRLHPRPQEIARRCLGSLIPVAKFRNHLWRDRVDWSALDPPAARLAARRLADIDFR